MYRKACGTNARPARQCSIIPILKRISAFARSVIINHRITARTRLDWLLDAEGRFEIGAEVSAAGSLEIQGQPEIQRAPDRSAA